MTTRLWALWRMEYLLEEKTDECVFCLAAGNIPEKNSQFRVLAARTNEFTILNKYPYSYAHILVSPVRHVKSLEELSSSEAESFFKLVVDSQTAIKKAISPEGINMGLNIGKAAGAGIDQHIHMHIVPRWTGDTNFMPVLNECSILPGHLDNTYEQLLPHFNNI
ncbi:MAG: HIT domain-containing protein [Deltaproteobacteria bacterium]|nr:HIT domain-containing protein [Deltaproteobacteria bacterium]